MFRNGKESITNIVNQEMRKYNQQYKIQQVNNKYIKTVLKLPFKYQNTDYTEIQEYAIKKTILHFKHISLKREYGNNYETN